MTELHLIRMKLATLVHKNLLQSCNTCLQTGKQQILLPIKRGVLMNASQIKPIEFNGNYFQSGPNLYTSRVHRGDRLICKLVLLNKASHLPQDMRMLCIAVSWNLTQAKRYRERLKRRHYHKRLDHNVILKYFLVWLLMGQTKEEALAKKNV